MNLEKIANDVAIRVIEKIAETKYKQMWETISPKSRSTIEEAGILNRQKMLKGLETGVFNRSEKLMKNPMNKLVSLSTNPMSELPSEPGTELTSDQIRDARKKIQGSFTTGVNPTKDNKLETYITLGGPNEHEAFFNNHSLWSGGEYRKLDAETAQAARESYNVANMHEFDEGDTFKKRWKEALDKDPTGGWRAKAELGRGKNVLVNSGHAGAEVIEREAKRMRFLPKNIQKLYTSLRWRPDEEMIYQRVAPSLSEFMK